jgi:crossover junction endodeoxyribonuclease RusA
MTRDYLLRLSWPSRHLSPNARVHWAARAKAVKAYREEARYVAQSAGCRVLGCDGLDLAITFYPPRRGRHDLDNLLARMKAAIDGIADASGVDDSRYTYSLSMDGPVKGGAVLVHVKPSPRP